jgi:hypothetical protein
VQRRINPVAGELGRVTVDVDDAAAVHIDREAPPKSWQHTRVPRLLVHDPVPVDQAVSLVGGRS